MFHKFLTFLILSSVSLMSLDASAFGQEITPPEESETQGVAQQDMRLLTEEMEPLVVELRGLSFLQEIEKTFQSPEELQQVLRREIERTYPGDTLPALEKRLLKFGFIVSPIHLDKMLMQLFSQQIAGYYDPIEKKMVLVKGSLDSRGQGMLFPLELFSEFLLQSMGFSLDKIILSHELTHVIQDQHFDLMSLPIEDLDQEDMAAATRALVEGDATLVMIDYMLRQQHGLDATQVPNISDSMRLWTDSPFLRGFGIFQTVPRYIMDNLLFSYIYGFDFVLQLKKRAGWEGINRAYTDFPVSTEQILHPEKYFEDRDEPTTITLPAFSEQFPAWQELERNTLGEFNIQLLIDGFLPAAQARVAAEGWDGDRFAFYEDAATGKLLLIWYTTWDTEQDSREFFHMYRSVLAKRYTKQTTSSSQPESSPSATVQEQTTWGIDSKNVFMEIRGNDVLVLDGVPENLQQEALHLFWGSAKETLQR